MPCFADDSGFCVEALNDKPGVHSKRFLEKFSSDSDAFDYIITNVRKKNNDKAFFVTAISLTLFWSFFRPSIVNDLIVPNIFTSGGITFAA